MDEILALIVGLIVVLVVVVVICVIVELTSSGYSLVFEVSGKKSLAKAFVLDNPGYLTSNFDPTNSASDYSGGMLHDTTGMIIPNINGDTSWGELVYDKNDVLNRMISESDGVLTVDFDKSGLNDAGLFNACRLSSRKAFLGGLFIQEVLQAPTGGGLWPAIWLNGFIGAPNQYHSKEGSAEYNRSMPLIVKNVMPTKACGTVNNAWDTPPIPDPVLSRYTGQTVYMGKWPLGGECDILEQVHFSPTNLNSIHAGAGCEVSTKYSHTWSQDGTAFQLYDQAGVRSTCGATYTSDPNSGSYSGCHLPDQLVNGTQTTLKNGQTRYDCPAVAFYADGNSQIVGANNTFGPGFNLSGGGVWATHWVKEEKIFIFFWPYQYFTKSSLQQPGGPLSSRPSPESWGQSQMPTLTGSSQPYPICQASYLLNSPEAITWGCNLSPQYLLINLAIANRPGTWGWDWPTAVWPSYCTLNGKPVTSDGSGWVNLAIKSNVALAQVNTANPGTDPNTGISDGGGNRTPPIFMTQSAFKFGTIRVFQNPRKGDYNLW